SMMEPMQKAKAMAQMMLRWRKTRGGTVALSPLYDWIAIHAAKKIGARTRRVMTRASFQAYSEPPHCKASKRHTTAGVKTRLPIGSMRLSFSTTVSLLLGGVGRSRNKMRRATETAPMGKLT